MQVVKGLFYGLLAVSVVCPQIVLAQGQETAPRVCSQVQEALSLIELSEEQECSIARLASGYRDEVRYIDIQLKEARGRLFEVVHVQSNGLDIDAIRAAHSTVSDLELVRSLSTAVFVSNIKGIMTPAQFNYLLFAKVRLAQCSVLPSAVYTVLFDIWINQHTD